MYDWQAAAWGRSSFIALAPATEEKETLKRGKKMASNAKQSRASVSF